VAARSFLGHVCPAVGCPGRNSRRPGLGWCRRSNSERRNWLFPLGCPRLLDVAPESRLLPSGDGVAPVDMLAIDVASVQTVCGNAGMVVGVSSERGGL